VTSFAIGACLRKLIGSRKRQHASAASRGHSPIPLTILSAAIAAMLLLHSGTAAAKIKAEFPANLVMVGVPIAGYFIAGHKDDDEGQKQLLRSVAAGILDHALISGAVNYTSWGKRPNGGAHAFPSGHVTLVTSGAAFLQDRYGWQYGLPAYALVGYVADVRVRTGHHRWRDAVGGVVLGWGTSKFFVTPQNASYLAPVIGPQFIGFRWGRSF
jgi:membrane-associated phospholipid phosphatase